MPRRITWYLWILLGTAIVRWLIMLRCYRLPDSDQVMVGLMARHVLLGELPVFYWGQAYNGTLETYLTAAVFRFIGRGYEALHIAPLAASLLFLGAVMWLAEELYDARTARISGLALAVGPALVLRFSVEPGYNYLQSMAFGTLALALLFPLAGRGGWWRLPAAAFSLGLALWAQPLGAVYMPAALVLVLGPALTAWRDPDQRRILLLALGWSLTALALALGPALAYNLQHDAATVRFLLGRPSHLPIGLAEKVRRLLVWGVPVLLGILPPSDDPLATQRTLQRYPWLDPLVLAALFLGLGRLLWYAWRAGVRLRRGESCLSGGEITLAILGLATLGGYLASTWSSSVWSASDPRYLLPLYTLTPMLVNALRRAFSAPRLRACVVPASLIWLCGAPLVNLAAQRAADVTPLADQLAAHGARVVYGSYWDVYRLTFASDERLLPVVVTGSRRLGLNRYPPYLRRALHVEQGAWVVQRGSALEDAVGSCLRKRRQHLAAYKDVAADLTAYYHIASPRICLAAGS